MIKRLDPYHLTAGFAECGELHAFQEPHLSLDAPIRENYRPEMAYHHNDGSAQHPGSDGSLRMPPMTFEPVFNGLQAERQAVPEVARSNAYLGLITANLVHHNWYVQQLYRDHPLIILAGTASLVRGLVLLLHTHTVALLLLLLLHACMP